MEYQKINLFFLLFTFLTNCTSRNKIPTDFTGTYKYVDNKLFLNIKIPDSNTIIIEKKVEANRVKCIGNYTLISNKKIKINCSDKREASSKNSIVEVIPLRFNIKNKKIYLDSNTIRYKSLILTKE